MNNYPFSVSIQAENEQQAKELLNAAILLMKIVKSKSSAKNFCEMTQKINAKPNLIVKAMAFL